MARRERHCLVCGRTYTDHDAAPRHFCSVACAADAGDLSHERVHRDTGRARPARVARSIKKATVNDD
jgi:predicted nucleic acid-binding Zn ribbon protein